MADDLKMPQLTPDQLQNIGREAVAQEMIRLQQTQQVANQIIEDGRTHYGTKVFDEASNRAAENLGDKFDTFKAILPRVAAYGPELVVRYADNETAAAELKKQASVEDMAAHMIKTATQLAPHGNVRLGERRVRTGRGHYTEADWKSGFAQANCTDAQLDAHIAERWAKKNR